MADPIKKPTVKVGLVKLIAWFNFSAEASGLKALGSYWLTGPGEKSS